MLRGVVVQASSVSLQGFDVVASGGMWIAARLRRLLIERLTR